MPTPSASEPLSEARTAVDPGLVARFRDDLAQLIDIESDCVVVALSGGADSVALLILTNAVLGERCSAATVDHDLRAAAAAEAREAADLCASLGIAHRTLTGPLPDRAGRTANVSARARALRYTLLADHVRQTGADWLATAHHADDQLETTLMRLNRGAGVAGLAGVRRTGWQVVRPVLRWRRHELAAIVRAAGIVPVDDPSNRDDRYDRARLRKTLGDASWLDGERFATSMIALADAEEALAWSTQELWIRRVIVRDEWVMLDPAGIPPELVRRLVASCVMHIDPDASPRGPTLARAIAALHAGRSAMVAAVCIEPITAGWHFRPAPPRRPAKSGT